MSVCLSFYTYYEIKYYKYKSNAVQTFYLDWGIPFYRLLPRLGFGILTWIDVKCKCRLPNEIPSKGKSTKGQIIKTDLIQSWHLLDRIGCANWMGKWVLFMILNVLCWEDSHILHISRIYRHGQMQFLITRKCFIRIGNKKNIIYLNIVDRYGLAWDTWLKGLLHFIFFYH